ncbi:MAG TPA: histidine phosphatase family protein [Leptolyngbyaceae cyanobacterium M65_K2018_010]|nr:histidine phosphatase family protein [Leptolyngbyaceae cyanobacterium M65_K2018_010]
MTKTLIFFRHGKSDWEASFDRDRDRPLAERGISAAKAMGKLLAAMDKVPDFALTSPALRAKTTLELAIKAGGWACPTAIAEDLYEAEVDQVLEVIQQQSDDYASLMLVGHEPTWSATIAALMGGGTLRVPTAALAALEFEVSTWSQVAVGGGTLLWLLPAKLFTQAKLL